MNTPLEKLKKEAQSIRLSQTERTAMYARIEEKMRISTRPARPVKSTYMWYSWRMVGTFAVLVVVVLGTGTTYAAEGSLPGNPLYAIKVGITEPIKEALALSNEAKIKFHTKVAEVRLEEAETLASEGRLGSEARATIAANLEEHLGQIETIAKEIEKVDPEEALEVETHLDSSLSAHSEVLTHIGDNSEDESTRENSIAIAYSASHDTRSSKSARGIVTSKTVAPAAEIATFSVQVATESPIVADVATLSSGEKTLRQLQKKAEDKLKSVEKQFAKLKKNFNATTTVAVEARLKTLKAEKDYNETLRGAIELSTFISASKKFNKGMLESLLSKYDIEIIGEVRGEMDEEKEESEREEKKGEEKKENESRFNIRFGF